MTYDFRPNLRALYRRVVQAPRSANVADVLLDWQQRGLSDDVREQLLTYTVPDPQGSKVRRVAWVVTPVGNQPPKHFHLVGLLDGERLLMDAGQMHRAPSEDDMSNLALRMLRQGLSKTESSTHRWTSEEPVRGGKLTIRVPVADLEVDIHQVVPAKLLHHVDALVLVDPDGAEKHLGPQ